jgi:hypothetical protein
VDLARSQAADSITRISGNLIVDRGVVQFGTGVANSLVRLIIHSGGFAFTEGTLEMRVNGAVANQGDQIDFALSPFGFVIGPNVTRKITTLNQVPAAGWSHTLITYINPLISNEFGLVFKHGFNSPYQYGFDPNFAFLSYRFWI